jgi:hypothetical protein
MHFVTGTISGVTEPRSPHSKLASELRSPGKAWQGRQLIKNGFCSFQKPVTLFSCALGKKNNFKNHLLV